MLDIGKRPDLPFGRFKIFPSPEAAELFADEKCWFCDIEDYGPPHLVNIASELYWEHIHPVHRGRSTCSRFGRNSGRCRPGSLPPEPTDGVEP